MFYIYIKTEIIQNNISISKLLIIKVYIRLKLKSKHILGRDTNMFYLDDKTDNNETDYRKIPRYKPEILYYMPSRALSRTRSAARVVCCVSIGHYNRLMSQSRMKP